MKSERRSSVQVNDEGAQLRGANEVMAVVKVEHYRRSEEPNLQK